MVRLSHSTQGKAQCATRERHWCCVAKEQTDAVENTRPWTEEELHSLISV